jgi:hypothetical protein
MKRSMTVLGCVAALGCGEMHKQTEATGSKVIGKTTQDIKKFDPNAKNQKVSDGTFEYTDPVTGPLAAYGPALERTFKPMIKHHVEAFRAIEGRYPKDYNEFMEKIIKENSIKLPVLPGSKRWVYDDKAHELKVVEDAAPAKGK